MGKGPSYAALDRYIIENQPCRVADMYELATLRNGKLLRQSNFSLSPQRISQYMTRSGKFEIAERVIPDNHKNWIKVTKWQFRREV